MTVGNIRVFLVDDHALVRQWLGNLLRLESDIDVVGEEQDPGPALQAIAELKPDIAVIDLSLKRGSGLDLIKAICTRVPSTQSLVLSMHEEIADVARSLRAGARGYVMKSEATRQIVPAIRQVFQGRVFADPQVLVQLAERLVGGTRAPATASPMDVLSDREADVFRRLGSGHSSQRIADDLCVSLKTVQTYCTRIKEKLGIENGRMLLQAAIRWQQEKHL